MEIMEDDYGEPMIIFPDEVTQALGLKVGDWVEWVDNKDGTYTLVRVEEEGE